MGSLLSLYVPAAPPGVSKATQTDWNCPVCHSLQSDTAAVPCGHRFCLGCLLRHAAASATCPLCASPVFSARFSVLDHEDFLQCLLSPPGAPPEPRAWPRRARFRLVCTAPCPAEPAGPPAEEEFPAELWAELLQGHERLLEPARAWLRRGLDAIYGAQWWEARQVETIALATLCICGPDRAELAHMLRGYLGDYTAPLIHGLVRVAVRGCREAWRRRRPEQAEQAARHDEQAEHGEQGGSAAGSAGPSSPGGTLGPAPDPRGPGQPEGGGPGRPPAAGGPEQRRGRAGPQEDAAAPGPSALRPAGCQSRRACKSRCPQRVRRRRPRRK